MKRRLPSTGQKTFLNSLLVAAVCDVRGFSTLQAHIDDYIVSRLSPHKRRSKLGDENIKLMKDTRERATEIFCNAVSALGTQEVGRLAYAMKSTGDGFLVAIELHNLDHGEFPKLKDNFPREWVNRSWVLANALTALYEDSQIKKDENSIGGMIYRFMEEFGAELGLLTEEFKDPDQGQYRVPGALAIGSGTIFPAQPKFGRGQGNRGDAYGHPVNLAFRLCDKAGRYDIDEEKCSESVLMDRRVARMLLADNTQANGWLIQAQEEISLKGIEETWCYSLSRSHEPHLRDKEAIESRK